MTKRLSVLLAAIAIAVVGAYQLGSASPDGDDQEMDRTNCQETNSCG